ARIDRSVADVWAVIEDIERYARHLPMVDRAKRHGDRVTFDLKFKVGFFGVGFSFTADAVSEREKSMELRWVSGEPRDIRLRFTLTPTPDGRG
ncbi:SRPBCC family protein, partial [Elizabethkingia meningoseptica]|uniref:SRPBCC family protein n=1 Tax=Elizabethkingia meningoseptica TaxID=238 RepID=UPI0031597A66